MILTDRVPGCIPTSYHLIAQETYTVSKETSPILTEPVTLLIFYGKRTSNATLFT
jgi:hypothetical protein